MTDSAHPERLWTSCSFGDEGHVVAAGKGTVGLGDRFTISANGVIVEMEVVQWATDSTWEAQDVVSLDRRRRAGEGGS